MATKHAIKSGLPASSDPTKIDGPKWDDTDHIVDTGGMTMQIATATPATPAAGRMLMYSRSIGGRAMPGFVGPSGLSTSLQAFFGRNKIALWSFPGSTSANTGSHFGIAAPTTSGTGQSRAPSTSAGLLQSLRRVGYTTAATANSRAGVFSNSNQFWRGNGPNMGGFFAVFRWGCSDPAAVVGARTFVGFAAATTVTNGETSNSLNIIGVGTDSTDANLQIFANDGSGTASKFDLGASFPDHTLSADAYELTLFCAPNSDRIEWEVARLNTGDRVAGVVTTDLPVATQMLLPIFIRSNAANAAVVGMDIVSLYIETDY